MKKFDWNEILGVEKSYYSERVVLRPLVECDVYPLFMATTDPAFNRFLLWDAPTSVSQLSERIKVILDERRKGQMGAWVAADISTGAFMALFRAYTVPPPQDVDELHFETGIWLHPRYWLGGLSVEVTAMSYDILFDETPVDVLHAQTHEDNKACLGLFRGLDLSYSHKSLVEHENGHLNPSCSYNVRRSQWRRRVLARDGYEDVKVTKEAGLPGLNSSKASIKASETIP
jgi:RimJ/RimL family protein N-acetyltransferase